MIKDQLIKIKNWLTKTSARYLLAAALTVFVSVSIYWLTSQKTEHISAWIQAVGSVLAIIAVFWVSDWNRAKEQQVRRESILAVATAAHEYALGLKKELEKARNPFENKDAMAAFASQEFPLPWNGRLDLTAIRAMYHPEICDCYAKALASVPYHETGSPKAVQALLSMQAQFAAFLQDSLNAILNGPSSYVFNDRVSVEQQKTMDFDSKLQGIIRQFEVITADYKVIMHQLSR